MSDYENQIPPEIRQFIEKVKSYFKGAKKGAGSGGIALLVGIAVVLGAFTSFYTIDPDEAGVVLRFGKYIDTFGPGLHFKLPFNIDVVNKVKLTTIRKQEFGFRTKKAGVVTQYAKGSQFDAESLMLTGDLNVADVEWIVQYRVDDPYKFVFKVRDVTKNLRDVAESVVRLIVGDRSVNDVLTTGRIAIAEEVKKRMQEKYDQFEMGIQVTSVILQDVNPPESVKPSFNEVNASKQEQDKMVNEAWEIYNKTIPEQKGKAKQTIASAEGYAAERINRAKGEANRFIAVYRQYANAPEVTKTRIYLEKMEEVIGRAKQVYIMDPSAKTLLPHFDLKDEQMGKGGAQ